MREILAKRLTEPIQSTLTTSCPSMDLIATVTRKHGVVDVWRRSGQRVFGLVRDDGDDGIETSGVAWKEDGHLLAVALSNGRVLVIDSFSGKTTHQFKCVPDAIVSLPDWSSSSPQKLGLSPSPTSAIGAPGIFWSTHFVNAANTRLQLQAIESDEIALDDMLRPNADVGKLLQAKANLPRQLSRIDVETSLPKLSTLPATGTDDDVFSTRASVDAIFHPQSSTNVQQRRSGDVVDVLLASARRGNLHVRIFDSFEIGNVDVGQVLPKGLTASRTLQRAGDLFLSTHFLVVEAVSEGPVTHSSKEASTAKSLHVIELDLRFISQTSDNLPLLASKATQLQNLLRYISQIQTQLSQEVRTAFDLPSRFLRNVNETLAEQDSSSSFTTAAYHLIVTGDCDPRLKEWLVDEVGERGLKRWEKAVGDCLDLLRRMLSECLLPAIERSQVVVSRLNGLARFSDTSTKLGLNEKAIRSVRETLDVLTILCEDLLRDVCVEIREFAAFMRWIKWEAEVEALENTSERAEEMRDSYTGDSELRMALDYISGPLRQSRVQAHIDIRSEVPAREGVVAKDDGSQLYDHYKKARRRESSQNQLPKLGELVTKLQARSQKVFDKVSETLRKSILSTYVGAIADDGDTIIMDTELSVVKTGAEEYELLLLAHRVSRGDVVIQRGVIKAGKRLKMVADAVELPSKMKILDLKFTDDTGFFALVEIGSDRQLLWRRVNSEETEAGIEDGKEKGSWETRYHFPNGSMTAAMTPAVLVVNGRKGRRTVTVLDEAGMGFVLLSLDSDT